VQHEDLFLILFPSIDSTADLECDLLVTILAALQGVTQDLSLNSHTTSKPQKFQ